MMFSGELRTLFHLLQVKTKLVRKQECYKKVPWCGKEILAKERSGYQEWVVERKLGKVTYEISFQGTTENRNRHIDHLKERYTKNQAQQEERPSSVEVVLLEDSIARVLEINGTKSS